MIRQSFLNYKKNLPLLTTQYRLIHRNHPGHKKKPFATPVKLELPDKYLSEAIYPPVKPKFPPGEWASDANPKLAWHYFNEGQKYHSLKTIQERLSVMAYMNVQQTLDDLKVRRTRYFPIYKLQAMPKTPQMLEFTQYITKTSVEVTKSDEKEVKLSEQVSPGLYEALKTAVTDVILLNFNGRIEELDETRNIAVDSDKYRGESEIDKELLRKKVKISNHLLRGVLNTVSTGLGSVEAFGHLRKAQYANDVDIKAYWKRCGYEEQRPRGAIGIDSDTIRYQFEDVATFQIKCDMPLKPVSAFFFNFETLQRHNQPY